MTVKRNKVVSRRIPYLERNIASCGRITPCLAARLKKVISCRENEEWLISALGWRTTYPGARMKNDASRRVDKELRLLTLLRPVHTRYNLIPLNHRYRGTWGGMGEKIFNDLKFFIGGKNVTETGLNVWQNCSRMKSHWILTRKNKYFFKKVH